MATGSSRPMYDAGPGMLNLFLTMAVRRQVARARPGLSSSSIFPIICMASGLASDIDSPAIVESGNSIKEKNRNKSKIVRITIHLIDGHLKTFKQ